MDGGTGHERGDQGHHDQRHEHPLADQPVLEREQPQDDLHGAARVHSHAHRERGAAVHASQARAPSGAQDLAQAGHGKDCHRHAEAEIGHEVGPKADAGEEQGREYVRHHLVDVLARPLPQMARLPDGDPHDESAEDRVDARVLGIGRRGQGQGKDEAEHATRPGSVRLNLRDRLVNQPAACGQHQNDEEQRQDDGVFDAAERMRPGVQQGEDEGKQNPPHQVVKHGRTQHHRSHVAPKQVQVHEDLGDDGQRRNGERRAHEGGEDQAVRARLGAQEPRKQARRGETQHEREQHAE